MTDARIAIVYGHPWITQVLERVSPWASHRRDVVVEVADQTLLGGVEAPAEPGIGRLTDPETRLGPLLRPHPELPCPWVPASRDPVPWPLVRAGAREAARQGPEHRAVVWLVHIEHAAAQAALLAQADGLAILWDAADPIPEALPELARALDAEDGISPERFAGLHLYVHPERPVDAAALERARALAADFSDLLHLPAGAA